MSEEGLDSQAEYIAALVELHRGLPRQGPGDVGFALDLIGELPALPDRPRIADLGCGSGAAALLLAKHFQSLVRAVDSSSVLIAELRQNAFQAGLDHLVEPICADMATLDWPAGSIDLLWSEGAAYNLGFEHALKLWRPLLAVGGVAVVSEMSWFQPDAPETVRQFWQSAYPGMSSEAENMARAKLAGFDVLFTKRLPSQAWWDNYYQPLRQRMDHLEQSEIAEAVLEETRQEMALFEEFSDFYGYTFYVVCASSSHRS